MILEMYPGTSDHFVPGGFVGCAKGQPAFGSQILHFLTLKIPRPGGRMGRSYLYEAILGLILVLRRMGHRVETASGRY